MSTKKKIVTIIIGVEAVIIAAIIVFLFYINSDTVKVSRQLELAQRCLLEEDYEQAIAAFEIIIEIDPRNADAYLGLAEAYAATDDLENAVKILEKASKRVDSEEVLEMLEIHTAEIEQRELAAQRAAEAAQAAALAAEAAAFSTVETAPAPQQDNAAETYTSEPEAALRGFIVQDGELYYYDETGNYVTGWFDKNNNRYCARDDGRLYKGGEHQIDSKKYLFDQGGVCLGEVKEDAWKQAYIDYVQQKHREYLSEYGEEYLSEYGGDHYDLIYVGNDEIPELIGFPFWKVEYLSVFLANYSDGTIYSYGGSYAGWSVSSYIERGNMFSVISDEADVIGSEEILSIIDGRPVVIAEGGWDEDFYEWNGVQLADWQEFDREKSKVYNDDKAIRLDYSLCKYTYEEILNIIANY